MLGEILWELRMNRRQFLASSAAGALVAPVLLRPAPAATNENFRVKYFPVPEAERSRDVTRVQRRRDDVVQLPGQRQARPARSARRLLQADQPRTGLGAAWRDRRAGQGRVGHGRRAERDRARRQRPQGHGVQAAVQGLRQSQHRRVRSDRASTGSPARAVTTAGSIQSPATCRCGSRRADAAATA